VRNKILLISVSVMLVVGLLIAGCAAPASAPTPTPTPTSAPQAKVLEAVALIPTDNIAIAGIHWYADAVEEFSDGQLTIDIIGNGEVIPTEEQIFAVGQGVIDVLFTMGDDVSQAEPLGFGIYLSGMKPWEEREAGIHDFYREVFAKSTNTYWLGHYDDPQFWVLTTNVRAESPADLEGKKIRAGMTHFGALKAMGMRPVSAPMSDIYTSMERGIIDGFLFPALGWTEWGWGEVTKYIVGPRVPMQGGNGSCTLINLDKWDSLSKEEQNWLTQPFVEYGQKWYSDYYELAIGPEHGEGAMLAAGVERIEWADTDNEWFAKTWLDETWKFAAGSMDPEVAQQYAELIGR
jgi:TRAP-type transport system periplasmic protein